MSSENHRPVHRRVKDALGKSSLALFILGIILVGSSIVLGMAMMPSAETAPAGFVHLSAAQLKGYAKKLAPKINAGKSASEQLGNFGNHSMMVAHREGDGEAEVHETQADVFIVQSGEATLIVGGRLVGGKTATPGEVRGSSVEGGVKKQLAAGDIVHIPAQIPHQILVQSGKHFDYAVVKIDSSGEDGRQKAVSSKQRNARDRTL